jgi:hypothetical protein
MSKWPMRGHFGHLNFKTFPMTPRTPQSEVFWPLLSRIKHSGVSEDSKSPNFGSVSFILTLGQSGVATLSPHGCSTGRLVMLFGPSTRSAGLWLWCHWCKGLRLASKLSSFPLWPSQIDAMMPSFALAVVWSNPLLSPSEYLSELHGFERQFFCLQL